MANYQRVTLSDIKSRLMARTDGVGVFWPNQDLVFAINEAINLWQSFTGDWTLKGTLVVPGSNPINVPKDLTSVTRVLYNGTPLTLMSMTEMDRGIPGWIDDVGTPLYWISNGINQILLSPFPTSGSIVIEGFSKGPILRQDVDYINIGDEELTRMLEYAEHYLAFKEGMPELKNKSEGYTNWIMAMVARNGQLADSSIYRYAMGMMRDMQQNPTSSDNPRAGVRTISG